MTSRDRRYTARVQLEMFLNEYVADRLHRGVATNVSETGLYLESLPVRRREGVLQLEFQLPGTGETIWARGEVTHQVRDDYFHGAGVRLVGIARLHARLLRDYVVERRREQLRTLLHAVRQGRMH
jgi:hypothetical protein